MCRAGDWNKNTLLTLLTGLPTSQVYQPSLFKEPKLQRRYTATFNVDTKDYISKTLSGTKVNIGDTFNYESPTSSPRWSTSKGMTSCMGLVIWRPSLVRSTAVLTWLSRPFSNSSTRARPYKCLGRTSSWIRMTSPRRGWVTFPTGRWTSWKFLSSNRYSFVHRFRKSSDGFCFNRNSLARFCLAAGSDPVGIVASPSPIRKCAGVSAAESSPCVMGLELTTVSILIKVVFSFKTLFYYSKLMHITIKS